MKFESKLTNCIIVNRNPDPNDALFYVSENGDILCNLDGYAIVPKEEYLALKNN